MRSSVSYDAFYHGEGAETYSFHGKDGALGTSATTEQKNLDGTRVRLAECDGFGVKCIETDIVFTSAVCGPELIGCLLRESCESLAVKMLVAFYEYLNNLGLTRSVLESRNIRTISYKHTLSGSAGKEKTMRVIYLDARAKKEIIDFMKTRWTVAELNIHWYARKQRKGLKLHSDYEIRHMATTVSL